MSKITESAKGQHCTVRIPGICKDNTETTVFAHLNGGGMARKKSDLHGAFACFMCHSAIDGRIKTPYAPPLLELWHRQGVELTQDILLNEGLISIKE